MYVVWSRGPTLLCLWIFSCPSTICWTLISPLNCFGIFVDNQLTVNVSLFLDSTFRSLILMSVLTPEFPSLDYCVSVVKSENLKSENQKFWAFQLCSFSTLFWLLWVLWISMWILRWVCQFLWRSQLGFC